MLDTTKANLYERCFALFLKATFDFKCSNCQRRFLMLRDPEWRTYNLTAFWRLRIHSTSMRGPALNPTRASQCCQWQHYQQQEQSAVACSLVAHALHLWHRATTTPYACCRCWGLITLMSRQNDHVNASITSRESGRELNEICRRTDFHSVTTRLKTASDTNPGGSVSFSGCHRGIKSDSSPTGSSAHPRFCQAQRHNNWVRRLAYT